MSKWSGKFDFYDEIYKVGQGFEDFKKRSGGRFKKFDEDGEIIEVRFQNEYELIPYYAHISVVQYSCEDYIDIILGLLSYPQRQIVSANEWNEEHPLLPQMDTSLWQSLEERRNEHYIQEKKKYEEANA